MTSYKKDLIRNRIVIRALDNDSLSNHLQIKPDIKFEEAVWEALHFILPLSLSASRVCSLPSSKCWEPFSEAALQAEWLWARLLCESFLTEGYSLKLSLAWVGFEPEIPEILRLLEWRVTAMPHQVIHVAHPLSAYVTSASWELYIQQPF